MIHKKQLIGKLEKIESILVPFELAEKIRKDKDNLISDIRNYRFRVLLTGGFSSGKSALLNALMERYVLREDQAPETTIATELVWDGEEYIEAINEEGITRRFDMISPGSGMPQPSDDYADGLNTKDYRCLVYHLNNDFLKKTQDIILVDMPGIESNIDSHNKAISQYITRGSAYLFLVSCEDGTLRRSSIDFLREASQYPQSMICLISKCDLRCEEETEQVCNQVKEDIYAVYGQQVPTEKISVYDEDLASHICRLLAGLDLQEIFEQKYVGRINSLVLLAESLLSSAADALCLDVTELDRRIEECSRHRAEAEKEFIVQRKRLEKNYRQTVLPSISYDLRAALTAQTDRLTEALSTSPEAFSAAVNSIIRPVLYNSTHKNIESSFEAYVAGVDDSLFKDDNDKIKQVLTEGLSHIRDYVTDGNAEGSEKGNESFGLYQLTASALAITTDIIAPVIELVIVLLPNILDFFAGFGRKQKYEELRQKVQNIIIPQIVDQMIPKIEEALDETRAAVITEFEEKMKSMMQAQEETLEKCLEEKKQRTQDHEAEEEKIREAIHELNSLIM